MSPLGPPAPGLRVTCAPCPVWVCPEWGLCAEGAGLLAPTLHRAAGMTTAQAVFRPGLPARSAGQLGQARWAERDAWWAVPPRSPPALPPCPVGLQGGSRVSPVVSGRVTLDSHPHTSVLAPDAPRTWRPAPYKRRSGLTGAPATAPWPVTLLRSWGNRGRADRAQRAPSQRPYRTRPCPQSAPVPSLDWLPWALTGALAKVEWMLTGASGAAHAPPMANSTPLLRWTSRTSGFGHYPLNKGKHPLRNTTALACSLCPLPEWCWLLRGTSARTQLRRGAPDY